MSRGNRKINEENLWEKYLTLFGIHTHTDTRTKSCTGAVSHAPSHTFICAMFQAGIFFIICFLHPYSLNASHTDTTIKERLSEKANYFLSFFIFYTLDRKGSIIYK